MFRKLWIAAAVAAAFSSTAFAQVAVTPGRDATDDRPLPGAGAMTGSGRAVDRDDANANASGRGAFSAGQPTTGTGGSLGTGTTTTLPGGIPSVSSGAPGMVTVPPVPS